MSTVYLIATPIGNLEDITLRALRVLQEVDVIFCEDTRISAKLLFAHDIKKPLRALHEHSSERVLAEAVSLVRGGKNIAYISDAGTPGISDPGGKLIERVLSLGEPNIFVVPIPGPSALATIASIAGIPMNRFLFLGYPPHKKGRRTFFDEALKSEYPVIFYESSHRIIRSLKELEESAIRNEAPDMRLVVGRELTKRFETVYRGAAKDVLSEIEKNPKGEFVLVIHRHAASA